jgi:hypothetical protein
LNRQDAESAKIKTESLSNSSKGCPLGIIASLLILVVILGAGLVWLFQNAGKYDPAEYPTTLTQSVLKAAATQQNILPPTDLPADVKGVEGQCWVFLKAALAKNQNQYQLETRIYGDHGTPSPVSVTGADDVMIDVIFPDGTKAELYFYNAFLSSCRQLTDKTMPLFPTPSSVSYISNSG